MGQLTEDVNELKGRVKKLEDAVFGKAEAPLIEAPKDEELVKEPEAPASDDLSGGSNLDQ